jgi:hypothetical protein
MSANHHSEEQLRHERLCAYLFDELDVRERAAVEAELARDADYRAERERLAATIALVRDAVPAGDTLSDATRGALSAAAAQRQAGATLATIHPWPVRLARSPLTAAAAVVLVLGGIAGLALHPAAPAVRTNTRAASDALASADRDDAARAKEAARSLPPPSRAIPWTRSANSRSCKPSGMGPTAASYTSAARRIPRSMPSRSCRSSRRTI